jgi:hypothetical protein
MTENDKAAFELAMEHASRDPRRAEQLQDMLNGMRKSQRPDEWACPPEPWEEVARFAAYVAQSDSLGLAPWEAAPCQRDGRGNSPADRLYRQMVKAGISPYHPDPLKALKDAGAQGRVLVEG